MELGYFRHPFTGNEDAGNGGRKKNFKKITFSVDGHKKLTKVFLPNTGINQLRTSTKLLGFVRLGGKNANTDQGCF